MTISGLKKKYMHLPKLHDLIDVAFDYTVAREVFIMSYSPSLCRTFDLYRCHIAEYMWLVMSPILLVIGTVGNSLSICVLLRKHMRKHSVSVYLVGVACADLGVLYIGLLREWLMHLIEIDLRKTNSFACRLQMWLQILAFTSTAWILAAYSIDRYLSIAWPLFAKRRCTTKLKRAVGSAVAQW